MSQKMEDEIKSQAVISVLEGLGKGTYSILRNYLMNTHEIFLAAPGIYSMENLRKALEEFIGEKSARTILELAYVKMEELAESRTGRPAEA